LAAGLLSAGRLLTNAGSLAGGRGARRSARSCGGRRLRSAGRCGSGAGGRRTRRARLPRRARARAVEPAERGRWLRGRRWGRSRAPIGPAAAWLCARRRARARQPSSLCLLVEAAPASASRVRAHTLALSSAAHRRRRERAGHRARPKASSTGRTPTVTARSRRCLRTPGSTPGVGRSARRPALPAPRRAPGRLLDFRRRVSQRSAA
jgi:hypothetical protein